MEELGPQNRGRLFHFATSQTNKYDLISACRGVVVRFDNGSLYANSKHTLSSRSGSINYEGVAADNVAVSVAEYGGDGH